MKHDENSDVRSLSRVCKISYYERKIEASKNAVIGIKAWGKIDYLCKVHGWTFVWNNAATGGKVILDSESISKNKKEIRKEQKNGKARIKS